MNGMLVTVKAKETMSMIKNMVIPFIEVGDCKDGDIHAIKIVNTKWVPKSIVLRRPRV
jgi:hypothetical protein